MRFALPMILILAVFVLLIVHTGTTAFRWLKAALPGASPLVFGLAFGVVVAAVIGLFLLSRMRNNPIPRPLLQFSHYALGVLLYAIMFFNVASLLLFVGRLVRLVPSPMPPLVSFAALCVCSLLLVIFSIFGIYNATVLRTVDYTVRVESDRAPAEPIKIALISDLHLGYIMDADRLQATVDEIEALQPDLVCIAGDVFDGDLTAIADPDAVKAVFRSITAPVYACLGNHDAGQDFEDMVAFLADADITVLQDEAVVFEDKLLLIGRRDASPIGSRTDGRSAVAIPEGNTLPVVVLDHQPPASDEYSANDVDLVLSGHTHNGQLFPFNLITGAIYATDYGYYPASDGAPQGIVSSGVGTWGPVFRIGSRCEVVSLTVE